MQAESLATSTSPRADDVNTLSVTVSDDGVFVVAGRSLVQIPPPALNRSVFLRRLAFDCRGSTCLPCSYADFLEWLGAECLNLDDLTSEDLARLLQARIYSCCMCMHLYMIRMHSLFSDFIFLY
jgi:hypothetical protein